MLGTGIFDGRAGKIWEGLHPDYTQSGKTVKELHILINRFRTWGRGVLEIDMEIRNIGTGDMIINFRIIDMNLSSFWGTWIPAISLLL